MKLIKPSCEVIPQENTLEGIYKQIELAGRTCYKSENKITETSAKDFVDRMIKRGHGAMLEHGSVYLYFNHPGFSDIIQRYTNNKYSKIIHTSKIFDAKDIDCWYITTNFRVLVENNWLDDLQYICEPTEYHDKRITVKFSTQIAISREYNRHRVNSIAEQSTRYCNYGKDKFGNEISINLPSCINGEDVEKELQNPQLFRELCSTIGENLENSSVIGMSIIDYWLFANLACEWSYMNMIKLGAKPQEARTILPLDLNTELIHTAFVSDWKHFFELRTANSAHPDARALAIPLEEEFKQLKLI